MLTTSAFLAAVVGLAKTVTAQNVLFVDTLQGREYQEATVTLGYNATVVTQAQWSGMTTAQFASYDAIVLGDPFCGDVSQIQFVNDTKSVWSPAIQGNVIILGTDPSYHSSAQPGAVTLIDDSIHFAANSSETGLYFALSCYYGGVSTPTVVDALTEIGDFEVISASCYNDVHLVASSDALMGLSDADLSNWSCSIHEFFTSFPSSFSTLAIANAATGPGNMSFADNTTGIPYVLARGVTPSGCGNGRYQPQFGEECDNGSQNGEPGNLCSNACKCVYGVLDSTAGTCNPPPVSSSSSSSSTSTPTSSSSTSFSPSPTSSTSSSTPLPTSFTTSISTSASSCPRKTSTTSTSTAKPTPTGTGPFHFWGCISSKMDHGKFIHARSSPKMTRDMCNSACSGHTCAVAHDSDCYCADSKPATFGLLPLHLTLPCPSNTLELWINGTVSLPGHRYNRLGRGE